VLALQRVGAAEYWGGAAAVAEQLRGLGARPFLLAAVGVDATSQGLAECFARRGIEGHYIPARPALIERCTFVADEAKLFKLTDGYPSPLDSSAERQALEVLRQEAAGARLLIWCDHGYGMLTPGLVQAGTPLARRAGLSVAGYAPDRGGQLAALRDTDLLTVTERQLRAAMHDMGSGLPAIAWNLLNQARGRGLIVSLHKHGLIGFDGRGADVGQTRQPERLKSEFVPSFATHHVDLLGTQEAILATAALVVATGGALPLAAYVAAAAEALAVSRPGSVAVTTDDLRAFFAKRPELRPESPYFPDSATLGDIARLAPPLAMESTP
jgi:D-beta-D-heptose 7-phosphate kinase/D-beta-D-heptose 1-phosphate adenosyltransferase